MKAQSIGPTRQRSVASKSRLRPSTREHAPTPALRRSLRPQRQRAAKYTCLVASISSDMSPRVSSRLTWAPTLRREACASRFWPQASQVSGACSRSPLTRIGWLRQNPLAPSGLPWRRRLGWPLRLAGVVVGRGRRRLVGGPSRLALLSSFLAAIRVVARRRTRTGSGVLGITRVLRPRQRQKLARRRQQILMRQRREVRRRQGLQIVRELVGNTRGRIAFPSMRKPKMRKIVDPSPLRRNLSHTSSPPAERGGV